MTMTTVEKLLPQNVSAETSVLGSILIDGAAFAEVLHILQPDDFYREAHRLIYATMHDLYAAGKPAGDLEVLTNELGRRGKLEEVGGVSYVWSLANNVPTSRNAAHYAQIVADHALQRRIIYAAGEIAAEGYNQTDATELIETVNNIVQTATLRYAATSGTDIADAIDAFIAEMDAAIEGGVVPGIMTGFTRLDRHLLGLKPGELAYLCGRPGSGKSTIAAAIAEYVALHYSRVMWVSLEMNRLQLVKRLIASWAGIDGRIIRGAFRRPDGTIWREKYEEARQAALERRDLLRHRLDIEDHAMTISQLRQHVTREAHTKGLDLLLVDYVGLVDADDARAKDYERVSRISRQLKQLALELQIPVLGVVQMNRESEKRANKRPTLPDLRDSGGLEQDADFVLGVYRGAYYNSQLAKLDPTFAQLCELIVLKARDGQANETIPLRFESEYTRPSDWPAEWGWEGYLKIDNGNGNGDKANSEEE